MHMFLFYLETRKYFRQDNVFVENSKIDIANSVFVLLDNADSHYRTSVKHFRLARQWKTKEKLQVAELKSFTFARKRPQ